VEKKKWSGGQEKHNILLALRRFEISFHILSSNMISVPPVKREIGKGTLITATSDQLSAVSQN